MQHHSNQHDQPGSSADAGPATELSMTDDAPPPPPPAFSALSSAPPSPVLESSPPSQPGSSHKPSSLIPTITTTTTSSHTSPTVSHTASQHSAAPTSQASSSKHRHVATVAFPSIAPSPADASLRTSSRSATSSARQSRSSSPAPAPPLRTLSQGPYSTANVNATDATISTLTSSERRQITDSLRAHKRSSSLATIKTWASTSKPSQPGAGTPSGNTLSSEARPAPPSGDMPAPTAPPFRRAQTYRFSRTQSAAPPHSRSPELPSAAPHEPSAHHASSEELEKEQQRLKAAAAAKLAEQEAWEKTRGAGSAVLDLLKLPPSSDDDADDDQSGSSGGQDRRSRATTPGSASGSGTSSVSPIATGDGNGTGNGNGNGNGNAHSSSSSSSHTDGSSRSSVSKRKSTMLKRTWDAERVLPALEDVEARRHDPIVVSSADKLLSRGISEYTLLPKILGRGKFSSVFLASKPYGPTGDPQLFAIKHTPLFPHHPLIATRLLREPTLLAELPPHPNLVNVYETIRTPGHFYLVEEYLDGYVTLEALLPMRSEQSPPHHPILPTGVANCVLDQLLLAVHAIHHPLQICHRDIKPENILVHPDTLQLKLLDFGLATHFSRSEAKLSTCCGSPAFHCPEIVTALRNPLGTVHYWGPEVDAWTCGITMLRLLTGIRYPIGASHTSVRSMSIRAQRAVATIKDPELRDRVGKLLEVNGERRMRNFQDLVKALEASAEEPVQRGIKEFKSTTFIPVEPQHKMNLPLVIGPAAEAAVTSPLLPSGATASASASKRTTPISSGPTSPTLTDADAPDAHVSPAPTLLLSNPTCQPAQRVLSYVKYCLRCAGILYHCWPDTSSTASLPSTPGPFDAAFRDFNNSARSSDNLLALSSAHTDGHVPASSSPSTPFPIQAARSERDPYSHIHVFECVLEIADPPPSDEEEPQSLVQSIFSALSFGRRPANRRSLSTPPKPSTLQPAGMPRPPGTPADAPVSGSGSASGKAGDVKCLTFYLVLRFPRRPSGQVSFVSPRPTYSRSSSVASYSHRNRSRASSAVGAEREAGGLQRDVSTDSLTRLSKLHSNQAEFVTGIHPLRKAMIDSNHTTPRASRTSSPVVAHGELRKRDAKERRRKGAADSAHSDLGLTIETSPELLRIAEKQAHANDTRSPRSAPNSRSTSRARSRKSSRVRAGSTSHKSCGSNKIFVHVTDTRALDAVRNALSIGGTTTDYNPDMETDNEDPATLWTSPDLRTRDLTPGREHESSLFAGALDSKPRRSASGRHRAQSLRHASGLTGPFVEGQEAASSGDAGHRSRPTWADVPAGASGKPRSTISHGSDDQEQYTRGRSLGPAGSLGAAPPVGIPYAAHPSRMRASSNLAFAVVQEESSPSNTDKSLSQSRASQSKTMLDLRDKSNAAQSAPSAPDDDTVASGSDDFDLAQAVVSLTATTAGMLNEEGLPNHSDLLEAVSGIATYLLRLQTEDAARFSQQLDAISFDLFKAMSPVTGLVDRSSGQLVKVAFLARQVMDLLGEHASSREVYMAADMRCGEMLQSEAHCIELPEAEQAWSSAAETIYLMRLLNTVLPRIRTKKPQSFSQVFVRLPQCLMAGLAAASQQSTHVGEHLAEEAVKTCCSTALILVDWEARCMSGSEREPMRKTSREALSRFLQGVTVCLPYLAGAKTTLAEEYFYTQNPRYALTGKDEPSAVKRNESLFAEISKTLASLEIDLGSIWSNALMGMSRDPEDDATRETLTALGIAGFVLHVHLLYSGFARDRPVEWKGVRAQTQLEAALPVALLAASGQTKAAASPDLQEGKEDALADASLLWMQWCLRGLHQDASADQRVLPTDLAVSLAQTLATQSVVSPSSVARLARFKLLTDLLVHWCERGAALQVVEQLITSSPFAQLRAGGVSVLREALVAWLRSEADEHQVPVDALIGLLDKITVLPDSLEAEASVERVAQEGGLLVELLSLLYWLRVQNQRSSIVQKVHSQLGSTLSERFVAPLARILGNIGDGDADADEEALQQVQLVKTALERLEESKI
ncbi:likely protein kinase [Pseudozyma hubeiensis SY62]|uniref:Likely protein kinase n=1 Tax=Pseudozyma hubeiensis (strain SY62) TaxID=1305764 RepID=R9NXA4_PSEHS|nr:likely protein kinase [Pseudozyma hubeiensis SY62]GAC93201.1 likely protein kinase [Pseudozyma hubeiensis SY62]